MISLTAVVIGHNVGVDVAVLSRALPGWRPVAVIDTFRLSRQRYPSRASHRLGSLVADLSLDRGLPATLRPHRATYDAVTTARLFVHLIAGGGSSQRLADSSTRRSKTLCSRFFQDFRSLLIVVVDQRDVVVLPGRAAWAFPVATASASACAFRKNSSRPPSRPACGAGSSRFRPLVRWRRIS